MFALILAVMQILVVTDHTPPADYAPAHAQRVAVALRHFTPNSRWLYIEDLTDAQACAADAVVYLGDNAAAPLQPPALHALGQARTLVVARYHLGELRAAGVAFTHVQRLTDVVLPPDASIHYHELAAGAKQADYVQLRVDPPARTLATLRAGGVDWPYVVQDGTATFIDGPLDFDHPVEPPNTRIRTIAFADILDEALGVAQSPKHLALLRLEDVSVQTPAPRLRAIAQYLAAAHVPYGIGLIPDQLIAGHKLRTLSQDPELVSVLRYAQTHGATIILHGLHHSFHSPEDFEFWDHTHNAPLPWDSPRWMDERIAKGLKIERSLGMQPKLWETPHYAASAIDYKEVSRYFSAAWESRGPVGWEPWLLKRDEYGALLLPENLGYVSLDGRRTLQMQLDIAKELLACRDCIAAGFLHPSVIPLRTVKEYVEGLRALHYEFADPQALLRAGRSS